MAVSGRKPKVAEERRNRMPAAHDWIEVEDIPYHGPAPLLPNRYRTMAEDDETRQVRLKWPARTQRWWAVISAMPHCVLWTDADWQFALDVAEIHARFVEGSNGTELRIREKLLGTTLDARRDLRIRYVPARPDDSAGGDAKVIKIDRYRDL